LEALQGAGSLLGPNGYLALFTMAGAHQDDDSLQSLFDESEIIAKLRALFDGKRISFS
jgi:hypothetical protein